MDTQRKPLVDTVNSGSKLPKPSFSKLPVGKRERSPSQNEPSKKKLKFESSNARVTLLKAPRVMATRFQTSSRAALVTNPRRETLPPRPRPPPILNSTVAKTGTRAALIARPNLPISPIQAAKKKLKKRPVWDLKGRIQDMEEQLRNKDCLKDELDTMVHRISQLETQKEDLAGTVLLKEEFVSTVSKEVEDLRKLLREKEEEIFEVTKQCKREVEDLDFSKSTLERRQETLVSELNAKQQEVTALQSSVAQQSAAQSCLRAELEVSKIGLATANQSMMQKDLTIEAQKKTIETIEETIKENHLTIREHESVRRKLHNTILELKGNIRVFCRVRPLIGEELNASHGTIPHINFPDVDGKVLELENICPNNGHNDSLSTSIGSKNKKKYEFSFDRVFQPPSSQAEVFTEISQLVQSALDGYNVCIFAYGQTGSGKTYTMEGANITDKETMGMIPRATMQVFEMADELQEKGWIYEFEMSFLEIYNETLRDLLGDKDDQKLEIKMAADKSSSIKVSNLTVIPVISRAQIHKLLVKASNKRAVGETMHNDRSSRSHSVFTLTLKGNNKQTGEICHGSLNLVDLAGSERLKDSSIEGKRLKETQCINKSLSTLGAVFTSLANKDNHIPYRNSKLTYLLQNSLGGNSKTLMFVNVSPKEDHLNETLNSLRFATAVNNCNIGTAQKKVK